MGPQTEHLNDHETCLQTENATQRRMEPSVDRRRDVVVDGVPNVEDVHQQQRTVCPRELRCPVGHHFGPQLDVEALHDFTIRRKRQVCFLKASTTGFH